jgi:hypothetical protein
MAETSSVERACFGCFREEIEALRLMVMANVRNANRKRDELVVFPAQRKDALSPGLTSRHRRLE